MRWCLPHLRVEAEKNRSLLLASLRSMVVRLLHSAASVPQLLFPVKLPITVSQRDDNLCYRVVKPRSPLSGTTIHGMESVVFPLFTNPLTGWDLGHVDAL
jgi:hypothetical protein